MRKIVLIILIYSNVVFSSDCYLSSTVLNIGTANFPKCDIDAYLNKIKLGEETTRYSNFHLRTCTDGEDKELEDVTVISKGKRFYLKKVKKERELLLLGCSENTSKVFTYHYSSNYKEISLKDFYFSGNVEVTGLKNIVNEKIAYRKLKESDYKSFASLKFAFSSMAPLDGFKNRDKGLKSKLSKKLCSLAVFRKMNYLLCEDGEGLSSGIYILNGATVIGYIRASTEGHIKLSPSSLFKLKGVNYISFQRTGGSLYLLGEFNGQHFLTMIKNKCTPSYGYNPFCGN